MTDDTSLPASSLPVEHTTHTGHVPGEGSAHDAQTAATRVATSLGTLGYAMFALMHDGDLHDIVAMSEVTQLLSDTAQPLAARGDLAALAAEVEDAESVYDTSAPEVPAAPPAEEPAPARSTMAMLHEISFLDE